MVGANLLTSWNLEPLQLIPTLLACVLYARRVRTLADKGTPVAGWRIGMFWTGIALVVLALNSPIDAIGEEDLFFFHMTQHVLLGDLAPLCFVLGLTGPVLRPVLSIRFFDRLRVLAHPFVALPLWALDMYIWHIPFLYEAALHHAPIHAFEHMMFFTFGGLMWAPVLETLPAPEWFGTGAKLGYVAAVRLLETVLGNIFVWSGTVFYPWYESATPKWGVSALRDQNFAGVVMMAEGGAVTLGALVVLFLRMANESELRQRLLEQGFDPVQAKRAVRFGRGKELLERGPGAGTAA